MNPKILHAIIQALIAIAALGLIADTFLPDGLIGTFTQLQEVPYIKQTFGMALLAGSLTLWIMTRTESRAQDEGGEANE